MVRLSALGFTLAAASVLVPGVLSQVPACATSCATTAAASAGCDLTDTTCLCGSQTFATDAGACVTSTCSSTDQTAAITYFEGLCSSASSSVPSSGTTSAVSSTSTTGTLPTTTTTGGTTTTTSPTSTGTTTSSSTTSSSKPNHATRDQPAGVLGAGLALALALFA